MMEYREKVRGKHEHFIPQMLLRHLSANLNERMGIGMRVDQGREWEWEGKGKGNQKGNARNATNKRGGGRNGGAMVKAMLNRPRAKPIDDLCI